MLSYRHDTTHLEIDVVNYQFPHNEDDVWDSNWLDIGVSLVVGPKRFRRTDACLTTFELAGLRRWFEAMSQTPFAGEPVTFTEPNLAFQLSSIDPLTLRVTLDLELIPPWESEPLALDFRITRDELGGAVRSIDAALARFPRRGRR